MKHYDFGESEVLKKKVLRERVAKLIGEARQAGPLFLVFHAAAAEALQAAQTELEELSIAAEGDYRYEGMLYDNRR